MEVRRWCEENTRSGGAGTRFESFEIGCAVIFLSLSSVITKEDRSKSCVSLPGKISARRCWGVSLRSLSMSRRASKRYSSLEPFSGFIPGYKYLSILSMRCACNSVASSKGINCFGRTRLKVAAPIHHAKCWNSVSSSRHCRERVKCKRW